MTILGGAMFDVQPVIISVFETQIWALLLRRVLGW